VEVIKEIPIEKIVPLTHEIPIEIHVQSPIDRVIEVVSLCFGLFGGSDL